MEAILFKPSQNGYQMDEKQDSEDVRRKLIGYSSMDEPISDQQIMAAASGRRICLRGLSLLTHYFDIICCCYTFAKEMCVLSKEEIGTNINQVRKASRRAHEAYNKLRLRLHGITRAGVTVVLTVTVGNILR